ncbi:MAG: hypothetical protein KDI18_07425 [Gammaproteobacteria bacterium]|nr:hypothetical protein [Gammaproteobacteria bacterium]
MNDANQPALLILQSRLFPDSITVAQAVQLIDGSNVQWLELDSSAMSTADWDRVLEKILKSDKVVTL